MNIVLGIMLLILSFIIMLFAIPSIILLIRDTISEICNDYRYYTSKGDPRPLNHAFTDNCFSCLGTVVATGGISIFFIVPLYIGLNTLGVL